METIVDQLQGEYFEHLLGEIDTSFAVDGVDKKGKINYYSTGNRTEYPFESRHELYNKIVIDKVDEAFNFGSIFFYQPLILKTENRSITLKKGFNLEDLVQAYFSLKPKDADDNLTVETVYTGGAKPTLELIFEDY